MASTVKMDHDKAVVVNTTGVDTSDIGDALRQSFDPQARHLADTLGAWVERVSEPRGPNGRRRRRIGGLLERDRWVTPDSTFEKIALARDAMKDDIISTAADGTEAFALAKTAIYCDDPEQEDVWNQWAGDINLDDQLRKGWRVLFSDSQFAVVTWWDHRTYKVRGKTNKGNEKRKTFEDMLVPIGWSYLDTAKVVPVGNLMFGQERLAYRPTAMEAMRIERVLFKRDNPGQAMPSTIRTGPGRGQLRYTPRAMAKVTDELELDDPFIEQVIVGRYQPDITEWRLLQEDGVDPTYLYELRPDMVFRHCLTRPDYQRFSDVRMEGVFPFLDLKAQLMQLDRVTLIGGAHFIVLVTIGTEKEPGQQPEIDAFRANAFTLATVPVVVGDQRLKIEIITPSQDKILERSKYDTVNAAIFEGVWSSFHHDASRTEDPVKTAKVIAKNLESRRLMLRRTIEREVIDRMRRRNQDFTDRAKLVFSPAQISLAFDPAFASYLLDLRASNEISRNTALSTFDISQEDEARMRKREEETYDKIFKTIAPPGTPKQSGGRVPAGDPADGGTTAPVDPAAAKAGQRTAGRRARGGGGTADGSGRGQAARRPRNLANANQKPAKDLLEMDRDELIEYATDLEIVGRHQMRKPQLRQEIRTALKAHRLARMERDEIDDDDALEEEDDE